MGKGGTYSYQAEVTSFDVTYRSVCRSVGIGDTTYTYALHKFNIKGAIQFRTGHAGQLLVTITTEEQSQRNGIRDNAKTRNAITHIQFGASLQQLCNLRVAIDICEHPCCITRTILHVFPSARIQQQLCQLYLACLSCNHQGGLSITIR